MYVCVYVCVCVWTTVTFSNPKAQFPENPEDSWNGVLSMLVAQDWYELFTANGARREMFEPLLLSYVVILLFTENVYKCLLNSSAKNTMLERQCIKKKKNQDPVPAWTQLLN